MRRIALGAVYQGIRGGGDGHTFVSLVVVMYLNRATGGPEPGSRLKRGQSEEAAEGARVDSPGRRRHATGEW